jgi:hypothetical protein
MIERIGAFSLAGLAVVVLAGCGSSSPGTGTSLLGGVGSTVGSTKLREINSASAERDRLLALAKPGTNLTTQGTVLGWPPANGSGIPASSTEVSGFGFVPDKSRHDQYLAFAVKDTAGHCAGGDFEATASGTQVTSARPITIPPKAPCTGDEAAKIAGHR